MQISLVSLFNNHSGLTPKILSDIRKECGQVVDSPPENIPTFKELQLKGKLKPGYSYICRINVKDLFSDPDYQRPHEINITRILKSLRSKKGFSYKDSNTIVAFMRPDGTIWVTQGNHRSIMLLIAMHLNPLIVCTLHIHPEDYSIAKCKEIEADNFTTDALDRESLKAHQKFRGAYTGRKQWAMDLYNYLKPYKISIAASNSIIDGPCGTFKAIKSFTSYSCLQESFKLDLTQDKLYVKTALMALSRNLVEVEINGPAFCALVIFLQQFESTLVKYKDYTLDDFLTWIYRENLSDDPRNFGVPTQQSDIAKSGSLKAKSYHYFASRYVMLFNKYAYIRKFKIRSNGTYAIPEGSSEWKVFIGNLDNQAKSNYHLWGNVH